VNRREILTLLGGAAASWPVVARAQQAKLRRIGFLRAAPPPQHELAALLKALADRDYVQGRNFVLVTQWGDGNVERLAELAVGLVNQDVELVVTEGTIVVRAMAAITTTLPIVTTSGADPFMGGLIKNLSHPGGNVTGFASMEKDISGKVFEIMKEMVPGLHRIAVLATRPVWPQFAPGQDEAAKLLGMSIPISTCRSPTQRMLLCARLSRRERKALLCGVVRFSRLHIDALSSRGLLNIGFPPFTSERTILNWAV
jgi:putative tryptophan/tyrosine transport system substrate-binding protein